MKLIERLRRSQHNWFHNQRCMLDCPRIGWLWWRLECWPGGPRGIGLAFEHTNLGYVSCRFKADEYGPASDGHDHTLDVIVTLWFEFKFRFWWLSRKGMAKNVEQDRLRAERVAAWEKEMRALKYAGE